MYKRIAKLLPILIVFAGQLFADLQSDIDRGASILSEFRIPPDVLRKAKGLVTMSLVKGGFIFSGKVGSGLVIAHLGNSWSAPSALGMGGAGWGLQIGAEFTDFVLVLNTDAALDAFRGGGSVTLGGALSVAAGPVGRALEGSVALPPAAIYSYGRSRGAFAGVSIEGAIIIERAEANDDFYGQSVTPAAILSGKVEAPKSADKLYNQLKY